MKATLEARACQHPGPLGCLSVGQLVAEPISFPANRSDGRPSVFVGLKAPESPPPADHRHRAPFSSFSHQAGGWSSGTFRICI